MPARPPADSGIVDTSAALASLYQAPFAEFIAQRSAIVSQLKKSGHKEVAARIASAAKPSRAAYLLNQVFWRARATYDAVLDAGTAARAAQQARLLGDAAQDLADSLQRRDDAIAAAVVEAERLAGEDGSPASDAITAQVRASFEALAAHGREGRLPHGHLVSDVELPGLAAFAGLILPATAPTPTRQFQVVARRPEPPPSEPPPPDPQVLDAERRLASAREREQAATTRVEEVTRGLEQVRAQVSEAEAAVAAATRQLEQAQRSLTAGEASVTAAQRDLERSAAERADAEARLTALQSPPEGPAPRGSKAPAGKAATPKPATRRPRR